MKVTELKARESDLLSHLRSATGPAHEKLDDAFGSLVLSERDGLVRFLAAHAIGYAPLAAAYRAFVEGELGLTCPDYGAMLEADLLELGIEPDRLPAISLVSSETCEASTAQADRLAGIAYVVSGSRLGLTVLRQRGYWGEKDGFRSRYMESTEGQEIWKALVPWLKNRKSDSDMAAGTTTAALDVFETFASAFAVCAANENDIITRQGADG